MLYHTCALCMGLHCVWFSMPLAVYWLITVVEREGGELTLKDAYALMWCDKSWSCEIFDWEPHCKIWIFCWGTVWERIMTEYYSSTLVPIGLYEDKVVEKRYGREVISLSVKEFQTYTLHISDDVKRSNEKSCHGWVGTAKFNSLRYIDDQRYIGRR